MTGEYRDRPIEDRAGELKPETIRGFDAVIRQFSRAPELAQDAATQTAKSWPRLYKKVYGDDLCQFVVITQHDLMVSGEVLARYTLEVQDLISEAEMEVDSYISLDGRLAHTHHTSPLKKSRTLLDAAKAALAERNRIRELRKGLEAAAKLGVGGVPNQQVLDVLTDLHNAPELPVIPPEVG